MSKQFDSLRIGAKKTSPAIATGLLQRSRSQAMAAEHDQFSTRSAASDAATTRTSGFNAEFSHTPVQHPTPSILQPKLTIGHPGDRYEQEADRVANLVVQPTHVAARLAVPVPAIDQIQAESGASVQRQPAASEEEKKKVAKETAQKAEQKKQQADKEKVAAEEKALTATKDQQTKEKKKKEDDKIQTQAQPGQIPSVTPAVEHRLHSRPSSGQPLPVPTRTLMESRFRRDFSQVRVHRDPQMTQSLNAKAFTYKNNIFFNPAQYQPEIPLGQHLLAHELTHVVQQGAAPLKSTRVQ
jgi:hypothetical protein